MGKQSRQKQGRQSPGVDTLGPATNIFYLLSNPEDQRYMCGTLGDIQGPLVGLTREYIRRAARRIGIPDTSIHQVNLSEVVAIAHELGRAYLLFTTHDSMILPVSIAFLEERLAQRDQVIAHSSAAPMMIKEEFIAKLKETS